jgi:hypothetical protein
VGGLMGRFRSSRRRAPARGNSAADQGVEQRDGCPEGAASGEDSLGGTVPSQVSQDPGSGPDDQGRDENEGRSLRQERPSFIRWVAVSLLSGRTGQVPVRLQTTYSHVGSSFRLQSHGPDGLDLQCQWLPAGTGSHCCIWGADGQGGKGLPGTGRIGFAWGWLPGSPVAMSGAIKVCSVPASPRRERHDICYDTTYS